MSELLDSEETIAEHLRLVCKDGSTAEIARALGDIARARAMNVIAQKTGVASAALYEALSGEGDPALATIVKVAEALGLQIPSAPKASAA